MDIKRSLTKLFVSLLLSPLVVYLFLLIAGLFGSSYEMSHGDTFIIWLLMAVVINQSMVSKE